MPVGICSAMTSRPWCFGRESLGESVDTAAAGFCGSLPSVAPQAAKANVSSAELLESIGRSGCGQRHAATSITSSPSTAGLSFQES